MSDVLIKGMEMPKSCRDCFVTYRFCHAITERTFAVSGNKWIPANYRHDDCPLIEIEFDDQYGKWREI